MGTITTIVGHKGGTAKTTTAINLGAAIAKYYGKKVLVVDTDIQLNATSILHQGGGQHSLYNLLKKETDITADQCIYGTPYENLYLLPNIKSTAGLEQEIIVNFPQGSCFFLRDRFSKYARERFDITLIDSPANLGTFPLLSLIASDYAICPNETGSGFSLEGLKEVVSFVEAARKNFNEDLKFLRVLLTKVKVRELAHKATLALIENHYPADKIFETKIPSNAAVQTAELMKKTVFAFRTSASGAQAYKALASEFLELTGGV